MATVESRSIEVFHQAEVGAARRLAEEIASVLGFEPRTCKSMALVASELATNLIKHAQGGLLTLTPIRDDGHEGLQIETLDHGPGIASVDEAMTDGFSTVGSLGYGLGSVNRMMDELTIHSNRCKGTHVISRKWRRDHPRSLKTCPLDIGIATRPKPGFDLNGDDFVIKHWAEAVLVGVIDGLGHGEPAHAAAQTARQYVEGHFDQPLDRIFTGAGHACRATRGCVMALARIDWGGEWLEFASIGNIEARVIGEASPYNFNVRRGIIGLNAPEPKVTRHPWADAKLLLLHSDGLATHWSWDDFPELIDQSANQIARHLLGKLANDIDDATALVVKHV
ncbi:MAG: anti-sigma regulatory factor [Methylococcus sp.]